MVMNIINKIWKKESKPQTKDRDVRKFTKQAIKKYEKTLRRLAYE